MVAGELLYGLGSKTVSTVPRRRDKWFFCWMYFLVMSRRYFLTSRQSRQLADRPTSILISRLLSLAAGAEAWVWISSIWFQGGDLLLSGQSRKISAELFCGTDLGRWATKDIVDAAGDRTEPASSSFRVATS